MNVTSASFLIGELLRIFARYQAPSENFADTSSPFFGTKPGGLAVGDLWCNEKSRINFSRDAMPRGNVSSNARNKQVEAATFSVENLYGKPKIIGPDIANDNIKIFCFEGSIIILFVRWGSSLLGLLVVVSPDLIQ